MQQRPQATALGTPALGRAVNRGVLKPVYLVPTTYQQPLPRCPACPLPTRDLEPGEPIPGKHPLAYKPYETFLDGNGDTRRSSDGALLRADTCPDCGASLPTVLPPQQEAPAIIVGFSPMARLARGSFWLQKRLILWWRARQ